MHTIIVCTDGDDYKINTKEIRERVLDIVKECEIETPLYYYMIVGSEWRIIVRNHLRPKKKCVSSIQPGYQEVGTACFYPYKSYLKYHGQYIWH